MRQSTETTAHLKSLNSELSHRLHESFGATVAFQEEVAGREQMCVALQEQLLQERREQSSTTEHLQRQLARKGALCRELEAQLQDEREAQLAHFEHPPEPNPPPAGKSRRKERNSDVQFDCEKELSHLLKRQPVDKAYEGYNREILEQAAMQASSIFHEAGYGRDHISKVATSTSTTRSATPIPTINSTYDVDH